MNYLSEHFDRTILQKNPLPDRADQVKNNAGGFVFEITSWDQLKRFLILGTEGGSYYVQEKVLTLENCDNLIACIKEDGVRVVQEIVTLATENRAPKKSALIFALAVCCSTKYANEQTRNEASRAIYKVCAYSTFLFEFVHHLKFTIKRGWGRSIKRAIRNWYNKMDVDKLEYQFVKYPGRRVDEKHAQSKWDHRDLLRLSHPLSSSPRKRALYNLITKSDPLEHEFKLYNGAVEAKICQDKERIIELIKIHRLTREMVNTEFHVDKDVLQALLPNLGYMALIRNLANLSKHGVISDHDFTMVDYICSLLVDDLKISRSRIHPFNILVSLMMYKRGQNRSGSYTVNGKILQALSTAYVKAYGNVTPTNKNLYVGCDVSSSMGWNQCAGLDISSREAAASMCAVWTATEKRVIYKAFTSQLSDLMFTEGHDVNQIISEISNRNFGGTDTSLIIMDAYDRKLKIDCFIVLTDNETWAGEQHTCSVLEDYRLKFNPNARLIVAGFSPSGYTIADPKDTLSLNVVGCDSATPQLMSNFIIGEF